MAGNLNSQNSVYCKLW